MPRIVMLVTPFPRFFFYLLTVSFLFPVCGVLRLFVSLGALHLLTLESGRVQSGERKERKEKKNMDGDDE